MNSIPPAHGRLCLASHAAPALGYHLDSGRASLVYRGDAYVCDDFWREFNQIDKLRYLIMEIAFSDGEWPLALQPRHLCPALLGDDHVFEL